ncbi:MAG: hypothetical protein ACXU8S_05080 [Phenylobacterium sp.]
MSRNQRIIDLHHQGFEPASIASQLGIRPHVAEDVLRDAGLVGAPVSSIAPPPPPKNRKPTLEAPALIAGGFHHTGVWSLDEAGQLAMSGKAPARPGLYAFVASGRCVYMGLTLRRLDLRLELYRPGRSKQPTNVRLREKLVEAVERTRSVEIYTVSPLDSVWSGWPVNTAAGLEAAMLRRFDLPWNRKG